MGNCLCRDRRSRNDDQNPQQNLLQPNSSSLESVRGSNHGEDPQEYLENTVFNIGTDSGHPQTSAMTEEQQLRIAQRMGLIQHLPLGTFDGSKKKKECVICMNDFCIGDSIRFLPCLHTYHRLCIDDWLMRSFTCPSCMEPVDAALISTFYTAE